jgi:malate synthase
VKEEILTLDAKLFLNTLSNKFSTRITELLCNREKAKSFKPSFIHRTSDIRKSDWKVLPPPTEIEQRKVEITGPPVRKMIINALNSGADVYMADFEDSNCPTFENNIQGQINLRDAVAGTIEHTNTSNGKKYSLNDETAVLFVRPRGLHLVEKNYLVSGNPIPASLFDYGLYIFHNWKTLNKKGSRPYFYLPKLEDHKEARLWNDVFSFTETAFGLPTGTIRATVLIETLPAAFQMDEILYELREHSAGLNCGRWDYIFSFIKNNQQNRGAVLPDRDQIGMTQHFMRSYSLLLIQTCHKRGAHAMGGMAAQIPIKNDDERNAAAMAKVRVDKLREVQDGHDGTWVAHPALVGLAREIFDKHMPEPNQINNQLYLNDFVTKNDLFCVPKGTCTEDGLRKNVRVGFQYLNAWLNGNGCVPINNLMEDAATAEISRAQIWQWLKYKVWLTNGKQVTKPYLKKIIKEETNTFKANDKFKETQEIFSDLCFSKNLVDFLTPKCYDLLET